MLRIYNTLTRKKEDFKPLNPGRVGIYVCGPTVYGMPHLGHAKSYVSFDVVVRYLTELGYKVKYVQNITDVGHLVGDGDEGEDKIAKQAKLEQLDAYEIAYKYERAFFENMDALNVLRPSISCRATGFVADMIESVEEIIKKGYGYVTKEGNVYFDVRKYDKYGQLSNRKLDEAKSGERIEVADDKRNPEDFAIWKHTDKNALMQWKSPWGNGCPGWHMECTTLGRKFLGERFDIHGGGLDNIFPHHECELAQADVLLGGLPMNYFMHNGLITVNGTKMGKSLGNSAKLPELIAEYSAMAIRYFLLQFHYRSAVDFSDEGLRLARKQFEKINEVVNALREISNKSNDNLYGEFKEIFENFKEAMDEDFNTPLAMVEFNKVIKLAIKQLSEKDSKQIEQLNYLINVMGENVFGLVFDGNKEKSKDIPEEIEKLAEKRWVLKQQKDYKQADEIRSKLLSLGYDVVDSKDSFKIVKKW